MLTKAAPVKVKAGPESGLEAGQFEAVVSVFGNVDSDGDRVVKGAFAKSLDTWAKSGDPIPVIWTHDHRDPFAHIGVVMDAKETDEGLWVKGQLDIAADDDNPVARQVYRLLKNGRVRQWSYAYDPVVEVPAKDGANELREIGVHEVGPTLVGSNRDSHTVGVKSRDKAVSDKPWSQFSDSDYSDEQYARACVLDRGTDAGTAKQRYSLPVREPSGMVNRNGVHAAAAALSGGRGGVSATPEQKRAAARKLISLYRSQLSEVPPEGVTELAKSTLVALNALLDEDPELVDTLKTLLRDDGYDPSKLQASVLAKTLGSVVQQLNDLLAKVGEPDDQAKADGTEDEDADGVKSSESSSARLLAAHQQLTLEGGST